MIVAVVAVGMMKVPVDQVVDVIAVGNGRMTAIRAMFVPLVVFAAIMLGSALGRI